MVNKHDPLGVAARYAPQGQDDTQPPPLQGEGTETRGKNWPRTFLALSAISMGLLITSSILSIMSLNFGISMIFLNFYLGILCFFALSAELRQVNCLRRIIYIWIKYLYFLTTYSGRSFFYVFLGTLALGGGVLNFVAGCLSIALGLTMFVVNLLVDLPTYIDPEMVREQQEQRTAVGGMNEVFVQPSMCPADERFSSVVESSFSPADSGYKPPGVNEGPNAL